MTQTSGDGSRSTNTVTVPVVPGASTTSSSTSPSPSPDSSPSLGGGAIAGIAVGAAAAVFLLCAGLFWIYRRKKKTEMAQGGPTVSDAHTAQGPGDATITNSTVTGVRYKQELDAGMKPDLHSDTTASSPATGSLAQTYQGVLSNPALLTAQGVHQSTSPPPTYPGGQPPLPQNVSLQQQYSQGGYPQYSQTPQQVHEAPSGLGVPDPNAYEVHGATAAGEMVGDTHLRQELPAPSHGTVYEMSSIP